MHTESVCFLRLGECFKFSKPTGRRLYKIAIPLPELVFVLLLLPSLFFYHHPPPPTPPQPPPSTFFSATALLLRGRALLQTVVDILHIKLKAATPLALLFLYLYLFSPLLHLHYRTLQHKIVRLGIAHTFSLLLLHFLLPPSVQ